MKKIRDVAAYFVTKQVGLYAANASFFLILSIFPALVVLLALMRYTGLQMESFTELLSGVLPEVLMPLANRLVRSAYVNASGAVLSVSALAALWSAGRGMRSFVEGLNAIYEVKESRGYFHTRLLSMGYTFAFLLVLLLTLVLHMFGNSLLRLLHTLPLSGFLLDLLDVRLLVLLVLQAVLFTAMFTMLPNGRTCVLGNIPGALLASVGWQVFTRAYSFYCQRFTAYASVYGSVYVAALGMLWLYFCICIVFCGGVLNKTLGKKK